MKESMLNIAGIVGMLISIPTSIAIIVFLKKKKIINSIIALIILFFVSYVCIGEVVYGASKKVVDIMLPKHIKYLEEAKNLDGQISSFGVNAGEDIKGKQVQIVELLNKSLNRKFSEEALEYTARFIGGQVLLVEEAKFEILNSTPGQDREDAYEFLEREEEKSDNYLSIIQEGLKENERSRTIFSIYAYASENTEKYMDSSESMMAKVLLYDETINLGYKDTDKFKENINNDLNEAGITLEEVRELLKQLEDGIKNSQNKVNMSSNENLNENNNYISGNEYIQKLNLIEDEVNQLNYDGSTLEMKETSSKVLEKWDDALNEIYNTLKTSLSSDEMEELRLEQREWVTNRDKSAEEEALEFKGGTMEGLVYIDTLGMLTKERCYELVENYMK